jgi:hypothetical protein
VFSRLLYSLLIYFVCFYVGPMLLLTGPDRRKYLDDLKAKKEAEGNTASDQAGVVQRTLKRKDVNAKANAGVGETVVDVDQSGC